MKGRSIAVLVALAGLATDGCGIPPGGSVTTPTTVVEPTSTSTIATPSTTVVVAPAVYRVGDPTRIPPDPLPGSEGAAGSGCGPGPGLLPDGVWFGFALEAEQQAVVFDLACFFFGDAADRAAVEDGVEEVPVPNDYYIRNENPATREVPVWVEAVVHTLGVSSEDGFERVRWTSWPVAESTYLDCPGEGCLVWLYVNDGSVTEILEQFTP